MRRFITNHMLIISTIIISVRNNLANRNKMSKIRKIRTQFLIIVTLVLTLLVCLLFRHCGQMSAMSTSELIDETVVDFPSENQSVSFTVYAITPTYTRYEQMAELTR